MGLTLALVCSAACHAPRSFEGAAPSLEVLGAQVLSALAADDGPALEGLRLTEFEHNHVVWPELPASAPEVNFPVDFAWSNIELRNRSALSRLEPIYKGGDVRFESVSCHGEVRVFVTFQVLTDCWVAFRSGSSSALQEGQLFKDVVVRGGGYKIFRYYDEAPRRSPDAAE